MEENRPENALGKSLSAMSTASLQALLQAEQDADRDMNVELVLEILEVLAERTSEKNVDVETAWVDFVENHLPAEPICFPSDFPAQSPDASAAETPPAKRKGSRRLIQIALIAAICAAFLLGGAVTASAVGYDIWDAIVLWSQETFGFSFGEGSSSPCSNPEYTDLKIALAEAGITAQLAPNYLPEGYKQVELYAEDGQYVAMYQKEDHAIFVQIQEISMNIGAQFEKDNVTAKVYSSKGIDYNISTNMGYYLATWTHSGYECAISGVPSEAELLDMINSINMEEPQ